MARLEDLPTALHVYIVELAMNGTKRNSKRLDWLIRHRERTYYQFALLSPYWMRLMKHYFKHKEAECEELLDDVRYTPPLNLIRICENIEFVYRQEKKGDDGRSELYRKNWRRFGQHWWSAKDFWDNEISALEYRRSKRLNLKSGRRNLQGIMVLFRQR